MAFESIHIEMDGTEAGDLYDQIIRLDVELSEDLPGTFDLILTLNRDATGTWTLADDERLRVWTPIRILGGYVEEGPELLLEGYVTEVRPRFAPNRTQCTLEVRGMDASVLMDRTELLKAWPGKKDSDIAREILTGYVSAASVTDTAVVHEETLSTVIQRETDLQFLQRLALRNGFVCVMEDGEAYFGPVPVREEPQPVLAAHFGAETTLSTFAVTADALRPAQVAMYQIDRLNKEVLSTAAESSSDDALGRLRADDLLPSGVDPARVVVAGNATTGQPEMEALCTGLYREGTWFVTAEGEVRGNDYNHVLRPRRFVTVKGVGDTYSGVYYVAAVRHRFSPGGYVQSFRAQRDGLLFTGRESWGANGGLGLV